MYSYVSPTLPYILIINAKLRDTYFEKEFDIT